MAPQFLADRLTLFQPDYAHHFTTPPSPPRFSDLPTALKRNTKTGMCVVVNLIESGLVISYLAGNKSWADRSCR